MHWARLSIGWFTAITAGLLLVYSPTTFTTAGPINSRTPDAHVNSANADPWVIFDADPNHLWNRLHRSFYSRTSRGGREYGNDELDPLLWSSTQHLLSGPSYQQAKKTLDEFFNTHAERLISDPLKKVVLLRDLWAVFDWTSQRDNPSPEVRELQRGLAKAISRLALPTEQIKAMSNNYERATAYKRSTNEAPAGVLPADLFQPTGPWVELGEEDEMPTARSHVFSFSGRSIFQVFIRHPQGRNAAIAFLKELAEFPKPWLRDQQNPAKVSPNPRLPQFPKGTQLAFVRRLMTINDRGDLTPTNIIESVQIRGHREIPVDIPDSFNTDRDPAQPFLDVSEFKLSRKKLFASEAGGLRAVARDEKEFPLFQSHGIDLFEFEKTRGGPFEPHLRPVLNSCSSCHFKPGIHSVMSRMPNIVTLRVRDVRRNLIPASDAAEQANKTVKWKQRQEDWRLLRELAQWSAVE
ncbi:MAG TPA: hypothetical protein VJU86_15875 [Pyrinomonadaceae bacterium]|nr:hypothetical protein [Pyrinomonadaceae bacterium]